MFIDARCLSHVGQIVRNVFIEDGFPSWNQERNVETHLQPQKWDASGPVLPRLTLTLASGPLPGLAYPGLSLSVFPGCLFRHVISPRCRWRKSGRFKVKLASHIGSFVERPNDPFPRQGLNLQPPAFRRTLLNWPSAVRRQSPRSAPLVCHCGFELLEKSRPQQDLNLRPYPTELWGQSWRYPRSATPASWLHPERTPGSGSYSFSIAYLSAKLV